MVGGKIMFYSNKKSLDDYIDLQNSKSNIFNLIVLMDNVSNEPLKLTTCMKEKIIKKVHEKIQIKDRIINLNSRIKPLTAGFHLLSKKDFIISQIDGGIMINKYISSTQKKNIIIPSVIDNMPVTSIGNEAFAGCTSLNKVHIPNSVTSIGAYAFVGCTDLNDIHIPDSVTSIEEAAFMSCTSLTNIHIPDSNIFISDDAFAGCSNLKNFYYSTW